MIHLHFFDLNFVKDLIRKYAQECVRKEFRVKINHGHGHSLS